MEKQKLLGAYVGEDLYEAVRVRAFEERCPLSEIVRRALRQYVSSRQPTASPTGRVRTRGERLKAKQGR